MYVLPTVNGVAVKRIIIMIKAKYYLCKNLFFKLTCPFKKKIKLSSFCYYLN